MRSLLTEIRRRDRVLFVVGWIWIALIAAATVLSLFDPRTILGIDPWIKPMKFLLSFVIYAWTIAWLLGDLQCPRWLLGIIRWSLIVSMTAEISCIGLQSARGVPSHFNVTSSFDNSVFQIMGAFIVLNTLVVAVLLALFLVRRTAVDTAYLWGVRLGLIVFLLGSFEGVAMLFRAAHTVGLADGGPGLPLLNWSREGGDLRIAHFLGVHGLQAMLLGSFLINRWAPRCPVRWRAGSVFLLAAAYTGICAFLFLQALGGRPLLPL